MTATIKTASSSPEGMLSKSQSVEAGLIPHLKSPIFAKVQLSDLVCIATLGTGSFGRVELVRIGKDFTQAFALKKMKKTVVSYMPYL